MVSIKDAIVETVWDCELEFTEPYVGKQPKNPENLLYVHLRRSKLNAFSKAEILEPAEEAKMQLETIENSPESTIFHDERGAFITPMDVRGMLKERVRELGLTRTDSRKFWGILAQIQGLEVGGNQRIYFTDEKGNIVNVKGKKVDQTIKTLQTPNGAVLSVADTLKLPLFLSFTVKMQTSWFKSDDLELLLRGCSKMGGLRHQFGQFVWRKLQRRK